MAAVTNTRKVCIHCGTSFRPTAVRPDFCCAGCQFVHDLIAKNGLSQFYELQEGGIQPVKSLVFQKREFTWLEELARIAEREPAATLTLDLQGLSCLGCVWLIERLFSRREGALKIHANSTLGQVDLHWQPGLFDVVEFARELQSFGYLLGPPGGGDSADNRSLIVRIGVCAALAMNTMLFTLPGYLGMSADNRYAPLFQRLSLVLSTLSLLIGGSYFFIRTWHSLRQRVLHIDLPISIGLLAAWAGSVYASINHVHGFVYFDFVAMFVFLMLVGRWLQLRAVALNRNQLLASQPGPALVRLSSGAKADVSQLELGSTYLIDSGQTIPVRSRLESTAAVLGMEWINGESDAAIARRGRMVPAGAINCGQSAIELKSLETWTDSLLARLLQLTPGADGRDPKVERFIRAYIWIVLCVAGLGFSGWWVATGAVLPALQVMISVLVVSCPCASGVALPLCSDLAVSRLRVVGVFVRNSGLWAKLERVRKVIFDKTGTLTPSTISMRNPEALETLSGEERAVLLAMVQDSGHPVSGCIREQLLALGVEQLTFGSVEETIGCGLALSHKGSDWRLGRPEWSATVTPQDDAATVPGGDCVFARDGVTLTHFHFGELARDDASDEIAALSARGCSLFILSGDREAKVTAMADRLQIPQEQCFGELSPDEKAARVRELDARDTLYVGDGANDSLAFDAAWCTGTPAVDRGLLEQKADFYFLGRGLAGLRALLEMATVRRSTSRAVVEFAITYNVFAITLCLAGRMNPLLAAIIMPASSLASLAIVFLGMRKTQGNRGLV